MEKHLYGEGDHNHYYHSHSDDRNPKPWLHAHCEHFRSCYHYTDDHHHKHRQDGSVKLRER